MPHPSLSLAGCVAAGFLLLSGCSALRGSMLPNSASEPKEEPIAVPALFEFSSPLVDPKDLTTPWIRYATPGGRISFLHPRSWEVDIAEWSVSRTIHVTAKEGALLPADILFTVYPVKDEKVAGAMERAMQRLREDALTLQMARTPADLLSPEEGPSAFTLYRTTADGGSSLHVFLPRENTFLEIECVGANDRTAFPLRVFLESVRYRE